MININYFKTANSFDYFETAEQLIGKSDVEALYLLQKPSLFRVKGKDSSKAVLVSVLLHGCEPAGFRAFIKEINAKPKYALDVFYLVGNVKAAQLKPAFTCRLLPEGENYNRIWVEHPKTADELMAAEIFAFLKTLPIIAHLDLHSFTAKGTEPHALTPNEHDGLDLAGKLVPIVFINSYPFGTLVEQTQVFGPSCVIECGTNNSQEADEFAAQTLQRFFYEFKIKPTVKSLTTKLSIQKPHTVKIFTDMTNFKIKPEVSVSFSEQKQNTKLTLRKDIESLNITELPAGEFLGWADSLEIFTARDKTGFIHPNKFLTLREGRLYLTREVVPNLMSVHEERMKESGFYFFKKKN